MILHFMPIEDTDMTQYLKEKYGLNNITQNMLDLFQGSIGKASILKEKYEEYEKLEALINSLSKEDLISVISNSEILYKSKEEIFEILDYMNIIILKKAKEDARYTNCIQIVEDTKKRIKQNANYDMTIDNMVFNIWEEVN